MLSQERKRAVLSHIRSHGIGEVNELAEAIGVSASTIRRDLKEMDTAGLLNRVHGGASTLDGAIEVAQIARQAEHAADKRRIGQQAASLVGEHFTILITGGTTTEAMLPFLMGRRGLTVITNGLNVAVALARQSEITTVVLGGILRHAEMSLLGPLTEHAMEDFQVDAAFTGTYGIDAVSGLSGASVHEASTDRKLLASVKTLVVLAHSSKFDQRGPVRLAGTDQLDTLITDLAAPAESVSALRDAGVDVRLV